jgi:signal transduction histidine kinase
VPRRPRLFAIAPYTIGLLVVVLVLVGALAYKGYEAERSRRTTAEATLRDYAKFAAWEYGFRARNTLLPAIVTPFIAPVTRVDPERPSSAQPTPEEFADLARQRGAYCECIDTSARFFRYDWRDSSFVLDRPIGESLAAWVRDTVAAHERRFERPPGFMPLSFGSSGSPFQRLNVILTNDSYVMLFDDREGESWVVAYVLSRNYDASPVVTYGMVQPARAFAAPLLARTLRDEPLFPRALVGDVPNDSVLRVAVRTADDALLYESGPPENAAFMGHDTLDAEFGELRFAVALRPEFAGRLVVGGLPRSQWPLLLGLFVLTAALLVGAVVQLRRQHELIRLRSDFVSGVSHELRTPLTQIRLFAELLHTGSLRTDAERSRAARVMDQEARRLTYLVENVLAFSRQERQHEHIARERVDVAAEVRDVLDFFAPVARARAVNLTMNVGTDVSADVDRDALRRILLNLLDNAVKYGPPEQRVVVAASRTPQALRIEVSDRGPGIPRDDAERIWEPYERLERDASSAVGGSGIGLAVVRDLAALHGGRTWVEDNPGGGARFVVELGLQAESPHDAERPAPIDSSIRQPV